VEGVTLTELDRPSARRAGATVRRGELADFLRSRRARIAPEDVGLPPGVRRRTPGLRREEVAQLAGVGVTWYTWLEQGRPINASVQVLDAIVRTLRLDQAEREHLYRLADVPTAAAPADGGCIDPEVQLILDGLAPLPASVANSRYDVLAWNEPYSILFPALVSAPAERRNTVWQLFTVPDCCSAMIRRDAELAPIVGALRAAFSRHLGEPAWTDFVDRLCVASATFARLWAAHHVASPGPRVKALRHAALGELRLMATGMALTHPAETRMVVYTPMDAETGERLKLLPGVKGVPPWPPHRHG
jgi:hypothetical protein